MDGAKALLPMIFASADIPQQSKNMDENSSEFQLSSPWNMVYLRASADISAPQVIGLKFLTGIYIWADVLRCASIGWHYPLGLSCPYRKLLEEGKVDLSVVMGCSNWVMISILDIAHLEAEKASTQASNFHDADEYRRVGGILEKKLLSGLVQTWPRGKQLTLEEREKNVMNRAHGVCALIYLHIVVLGITPKIQDYVRCLLLTLESIPPCRLRGVSWPFCVAGCFATGKDRDRFRRVAHAASQAKYYIGTIWSSIAIMEEWWKLCHTPEDLGLKNVVAWRVAMHSLGIKSLLI